MMNRTNKNNSNVLTVRTLNGRKVIVKFDGIDRYMVQTIGGGYNSKFYLQDLDKVREFAEDLACYHRELTTMSGTLEKIQIEENGICYIGTNGLKTQPMHRKEVAKNASVDVVLNNTSMVLISTAVEVCTDPFDPNDSEPHANIELVFGHDESVEIYEFVKRTIGLVNDWRK